MLLDRSILLGAVFAVACLTFPHCCLAEITAERSEKGVVVRVDGKLFAEYLVQSGTMPVVWPLLGPTGKPMTRAYPMVETAGETKDHRHHRSMWFAHGDVDGLDFWHGGPDGPRIRHRKFIKIQSGPSAVLITQNDWLAPDGTKVCQDERTLTFSSDDDARWIDFDITLKAVARPVTFGDTKEGAMSVRVADTIKVAAGRGGKIVNSQAQVDAEAWGQRASWVDYHGPVDGQIVGIAIFNHPGSFRYPTYWHVRSYGLFAANPFGRGDFEKNKDLGGSHTLRPGEALTLRYRVLLHRGDEKTGKLAERFAAYAAATK